MKGNLMKRGLSRSKKLQQKTEVSSVKKKFLKVGYSIMNEYRVISE